jgi:hypothetical protein
VFTVKVEVTLPFAAGVTDTGAKLQVTVAFTGATAQVNPTGKINPFNEVTVTVDAPEFPAIRVAETGEVLTPKSFTVNV